MDKKILFRRSHTHNLCMAMISVGLTLGSSMVEAAVSDVSFSDVSVPAGVSGVSDTQLLPNFYQSKTVHSLGVDWVDLNNDDYPDLLITNGVDTSNVALSPHIFLNDGDGTFTPADELFPPLPAVDLTGANFADYDNDGDMDVYIYADNEQFALNGSNLPDGPANLLLKNLFVENGNQIIADTPLFEEVAAQAGVDDKPAAPFGTYSGRRTRTAGWLDFNRDGCVDLYVGTMVLQQGGVDVNRDTLYRNRCDGTFEDVTVEAGVNDGSNIDNYRPTLAFIGAHLDDDLWPDMYVVNVHEPSPWHHDFIFKNVDGTFIDNTAASAGVGDDSGSGMGIDVADIDLDGDWDVYISDVLFTTNDATPLGNVLYLNNGDGTFADNSAPTAGVASELSWGVNFFDVDRDGYEDLFVGTGAPGLNPLFINNQSGGFLPAFIEAGMDEGSIRGSATADYDRDGDLDIAMVNQSGEFKLYRNDSTDTGNWIELKLTGVVSSRDAINAMVKVQAGGLSMMRQVKGGSSAHSQDDLVVHFGLADATIVDQVQVLWPSGTVDTLLNVEANQLLALTEEGVSPPEPTVRRVTPKRLYAGADYQVKIRGKDFQPGALVSINNEPGGVSITSVRVIDSTLIRITVSVAADAVLGRRVTHIENPDGKFVDVTKGIQIVAPR